MAQSFAGWPFARTGSLVKTEDDPLDPNPIEAMRTTIAAIRHLEAAVIGADWTEGIALRYGGLYGPGTSLDSADGEMTEMIRRRFFPIVGDGNGMFSFIHVADAADATLAAVEHGTRGVYHIVDDEPAPIREWLPVVADRLGAKPPFRIPRWLGRLVGGEMIVTMSTETRGASNERAKRVLGWTPRHASWRDKLGADGGVTGAEPDPELEILRRRAFAIAYRMLGSVAEAEDVVQEALLRLHRVREAGRGDRLAGCVRHHDHHPPGDRPSPVGTGAPRAIHGRLATGAAHRVAGRRPRATRRNARLALVRVPGRARAPLARAAGGRSCCATSSGTGTTRSPRSST